MSRPTNQHSRGFLLGGEVQSSLDSLNTLLNAADSQVALGGSVGFAAGTGTTVTNNSTFNGGVGSSSYTIGDIVTALKNLGLIAS